MSVTSVSITGGGSVDEHGVPLTGCLELGVLAGTGLNKAEFLKKSNTFVTVTFNGEKVGQTAVIPSSQNPEWDTSFVVPVPYGRDFSLCVLELHVYHKKSETKDVLIGYRRFTSSELMYLGTIADELAAYEQASQSEAQSDDGPPADVGVFELHLAQARGPAAQDQGAHPAHRQLSPARGACAGRDRRGRGHPRGARGGGGPEAAAQGVHDAGGAAAGRA